MNDDGVATLGVSRIERSFEAVMIFLTGRELAGDRALADVHTLGERIEGLSGAGMHTIVICPAELEDLSVRLPAQPNGPGHLLLCRSNASEICDVRAGRSEPIAHSFPDADDASNAARFAAAWLAQSGITGELVLIVSDAFDRDLEAAGALYVGELSRAFVVATAGERGRLPERAHRVRGGPFTLAALLDEQLQRRSERRVPSIDADPRWTISLPAARAKERVAESLGVLTNGWAGVRASIEEDGAGTAPLFSSATPTATTIDSSRDRIGSASISLSIITTSAVATSTCGPGSLYARWGGPGGSGRCGCCPNTSRM